MKQISCLFFMAAKMLNPFCVLDSQLFVLFFYFLSPGTHTHTHIIQRGTERVTEYTHGHNAQGGCPLHLLSGDDIIIYV